MAEKRDLDDTDLKIIGLLAENARRSFREIAEQVDLSAPAVSDRIDRLHDQGIIRRFTVDLDRTQIHGRTPILVELQAVPAHVESVFETVRSLDGIEHAFMTVDGRIVAHGTAPEYDPGGWLRSTLEMDHLRDLSVDLIDRYEWQMDVDDTAFRLSCVVCGNAVRDDGITVEIDGDTKAFCCPSCRSNYEDRLDTYRSRSA